jgi:hypothetical protein
MRGAAIGAEFSSGFVDVSVPCGAITTFMDPVSSQAAISFMAT